MNIVKIYCLNFELAKTIFILIGKQKSEQVHKIFSLFIKRSLPEITYTLLAPSKDAFRNILNSVKINPRWKLSPMPRTLTK